jgi:hypothetical protein
MSQQDLATQIGRAWRYHREGRHDDAIAEFERVLKQDRNNVDAYYGLGLAQRKAGLLEAAEASFKRALELAEGERKQHGDGVSDHSTMLVRMIRQRLAEIKPESYGYGGHINDAPALQASSRHVEYPPPGRSAPPPPDNYEALLRAGSTEADTSRTEHVGFPSRREVLAALAGIAPFFLSASVASTETVNGEVVSSSYTDFVAIVGGAIAVVLALSVVGLFAKTADADKTKRYVGFVVLLVLGAFQVLRGFGVVRL